MNAFKLIVLLYPVCVIYCDLTQSFFKSINYLSNLFICHGESFKSYYFFIKITLFTRIQREYPPKIMDNTCELLQIRLVPLFISNTCYPMMEVIRRRKIQMRICLFIESTEEHVSEETCYLFSCEMIRFSFFCSENQDISFLKKSFNF